MSYFSKRPSNVGAIGLVGGLCALAEPALGGGRTEHGRYRLDADVVLVGINDDHPWHCPVLRWHGTQEERSSYPHAKFRCLLHGYNHLDGHWL